MSNGNKQCLGCGQEIDTNYKYCERCFKLKNYGEITEIEFNQEQYFELINKYLKTKDLICLVCDVVNLPNDFDLFKSIFKNNHVILILNKIDLLPKSVNLNKIKSKLTMFDKIIGISSTKRHGLDSLYKIIRDHDGNVMMLGLANAGKSTLINQLLNSYTDTNNQITTSYHAGTTLDVIKIKFLDKNLVDTPGLMLDGDISKHLNKSEVKLITPTKEIKPSTFILKTGQGISINEYLRLEYEGEETSITCYMANQLSIKRINAITNNINKEKIEQTILIDERSDIVIQGLGFIKVTKPGLYRIYTFEGVLIFKRDAII